MKNVYILKRNFFFLMVFAFAFIQCESVDGNKHNALAVNAQKDSLSFCLLNFYEPLSDKKAGGIYENYATFLAERLDKTPKFIYLNSAYFNRPVRDGIKKGICDCQMGQPIEEAESWLIPRKIRQSTAYTSIGYSIATKDASIQDLSDLNGKKVIVMSQSPPLSKVGDLDSVSIKLMIHEPKMMQLLNDGEVDAVVAWGPKLYQLNKEKYDSKFRVFDTEYMWDVALLTQAKDSTLMHDLNTIIKESPKKYDAIAAAYGF